MSRAFRFHARLMRISVRRLKRSPFVEFSVNAFGPALFALFAFLVASTAASMVRAKVGPSLDLSEVVGFPVTYAAFGGSVLTVLMLMLGWVKLTRGAIAAVLTLASSWMLVFTGIGTWSLPISACLQVLALFASMEITWSMRPWSNESWNGSALGRRASDRLLLFGMAIIAAVSGTFGIGILGVTVCTLVGTLMFVHQKRRIRAEQT